MNQNVITFIKENSTENVVSEMVAILPGFQCVNPIIKMCISPRSQSHLPAMYLPNQILP